MFMICVTKSRATNIVAQVDQGIIHIRRRIQSMVQWCMIYELYLHSSPTFQLSMYLERIIHLIGLLNLDVL